MRQFRLSTILLAMLVLACSFGLAGRWGILVATAVMVCYAALVYGLQSGKWRPLVLLLSPAIFVLFSWYFEHASVEARKAASSLECADRLKQIGTALAQYRHDYGLLPPPTVWGKDGKRMHSWRSLLLPYLEPVKPDLPYRFDEPWDGQNNSRLFYPGMSDPTVFQGSSFLALAGPGTAWEAQSTPSSSNREPSGNQILVVEAVDVGTWLAPHDMSIEEALYNTRLPSRLPVSSQPASGAHVLLDNGDVVSVAENADPRLFRMAILGKADSSVWKQLHRGRWNMTVRWPLLFWLFAVATLIIHGFVVTRRKHPVDSVGERRA